MADGKIQVKLPPAFYWDHRFRDLPSGEVVKETSRYVLVNLTPDELAEIESDASYYATEGKYMGRHLQGIVSSARATLRRIKNLKQQSNG